MESAVARKHDNPEVPLKDYLDVRFKGLEERLQRMEDSFGLRANKSEETTTSLFGRVEILERKETIWDTKMKVWGALLTMVFTVIAGIVSVLVKVFVP